MFINYDKYEHVFKAVAVYALFTFSFLPILIEYKKNKSVSINTLSLIAIIYPYSVQYQSLVSFADKREIGHFMLWMLGTAVIVLVNLLIYHDNTKPVRSNDGNDNLGESKKLGTYMWLIFVLFVYTLFLFRNSYVIGVADFFIGLVE